MRQPTRISLALASLFLVSTNAQAGLTATVTAASDYLFDGVSQTDSGPALQASLDYAHDSGFYIGTWASNIDFPLNSDFDSGSIEQDYYGGFYTSLADGFDIDLGAAKYTYHGAPTNYDYTEYYAGVVLQGNYKFKYYYSDDDFVWAGTAWRIKGNQSIELNEQWKLNLEETYTRFSDGADAYGYNDDDQWHAKIGLATTWSGFTIEFGVQGTDESDYYSDFYGDENVGTTLYVTAARTFELL